MAASERPAYFRCRTRNISHSLLAMCGFSHLQRTNVSNILKMSWYLLLSLGIAAARDTNSNRRFHCTRDSDCMVEMGEICYKLYDGCSQGLCMCKPGAKPRDKNGRCSLVRRGGESCSSRDQCPDSFDCYYGKCTCFVGEMTLDGDYCLRATEKLLGHTCNPSSDKCVQKSGDGYISQEVVCADIGVCECTEGLIPDAYTCRRHRIGEYGCIQNHHCDGGSVCVNRQCICPAERIPMAGNTKCGRTGALHGLPLGSSCDEIGETRYCEQGLVCHSCGTHGISICVRAKLPPYQSPLYARQGAPQLTPSQLCLLISSTVTYILFRTR